MEFTVGEGTAYLLEDDGSSGGGVVDEGDLIHVVSINKVFNNCPRVEYPLAERIEVEIVGLLKELELPLPLGSEHRSGAAPEATVVDSGYARQVVSELSSDFGFGYEPSETGLLGGLVLLRRFTVSRIFVFHWGELGFVTKIGHDLKRGSKMERVEASLTVCLASEDLRGKCGGRNATA